MALDSYILFFVAFVNALFKRSLAAKNASQGMAKDIIFFSHTDYCFPSPTLASLLISKEGGADAIHVYLVYCVVLFLLSTWHFMLPSMLASFGNTILFSRHYISHIYIDSRLSVNY